MLRPSVHFQKVKPLIRPVAYHQGLTHHSDTGSPNNVTKHMLATAADCQPDNLNLSETALYKCSNSNQLILSRNSRVGNAFSINSSLFVDRQIWGGMQARGFHSSTSLLTKKSDDTNKPEPTTKQKKSKVVKEEQDIEEQKRHAAEVQANITPQPREGNPNDTGAKTPKDPISDSFSPTSSSHVNKQSTTSHPIQELEADCKNDTTNPARDSASPTPSATKAKHPQVKSSRARTTHHHSLETTIPTPKSLKKYLDQYSIGQHRAKKHFSVAIYNHYVRLQDKYHHDAELERIKREQEFLDSYPDEEEIMFPQRSLRSAIEGNPADDFENSRVIVEKSNILLLGPSGSGKSLLARVLARVLDVPFAVSDCTSMTQAGYFGDDVESCIQRLAAAADWDPQRIESGIVVLDEFDKIAKKDQSGGSGGGDGRRDVAGEGVQQSLLKLVEGTKIQLTLPPSSQRGFGGKTSESITVDTSNILFIFMGAFTGMEKHVVSRLEKQLAALNKTEKVEDEHVDGPKATLRDIFEPAVSEYQQQLIEKQGRNLEKDKSNSLTTQKGRHQLMISDNGYEVPVLEYAGHEDLINYGIIPELTGRISVVVATQELSSDDLERVLVEPRNSIIQQYEHLFSRWGVTLAFTQPALTQIARRCYDMGIGARGLSSVLNELLLESNYDSPHSGTKYILVTEKVVKSLSHIGYNTSRQPTRSIHQDHSVKSPADRNKPTFASTASTSYTSQGHEIQRPLYFSGYEIGDFLNTVETEDPVLAEKLCRSIYPHMLNNDKRLDEKTASEESAGGSSVEAMSVAEENSKKKKTAAA